MTENPRDRGVGISRSPRAVFGGEVVAVLGDGQASPLHGANLSETGMLLSAPDREHLPKVGENLMLIFDLPELEVALQVEARVVRKDDQVVPHLGVHFENLAPSTQRSLRTYVFTGQGKVVDYTDDN